MRPIARNNQHSDYRSAALGIGALAVLGGAALLWQKGGQTDARRKIRQSAAIMRGSI